ncbi:MAG: 50S ribosomal protein L11 methyltransferase [Myxococcota bacterium]
MEGPRHPVLRVFTTEPDLELLQLRLFELGATGLEQHDQTTIVRATDPRISVSATFDDEGLAKLALDEIGRTFDAELDYVENADWATEWRRGFGPQRIGERLLLQPSWEAAENHDHRQVVTIDPENAFGSGDHETTRLVLGVLERRVRGGERVLDVGCGTGILSVAALKLGAKHAVGIDVEDAAVEVAERNARVNAVAEHLEVSKTRLESVTALYDLVLANIETRILTQMAEALRARLAPGGVLVLSGILQHERDEILLAFDPMRPVELVSENEWLAFVMESA